MAPARPGWRLEAKVWGESNGIASVFPRHLLSFSSLFCTADKRKRKRKRKSLVYPPKDIPHLSTTLGGARVSTPLDWGALGEKKRKESLRKPPKLYSTGNCTRASQASPRAMPHYPFAGRQFFPDYTVPMSACRKPSRG